MSTKKTTKPTIRQEKRIRVGSAADYERQLDNALHALDLMRRDKIDLRQQAEKENGELKKERDFWFWLCNDFRYHSCRLAVAMQTRADYAPAEDSVRLATMDIMMSPSDPNSPVCRNSRRDHQAHRLGFGIAMDTSFEESPESLVISNAKKPRPETAQEL